MLGTNLTAGAAHAKKINAKTAEYVCFDNRVIVSVVCLKGVNDQLIVTENPQLDLV